jgi:hypothetical protein
MHEVMRNSHTNSVGKYGAQNFGVDKSIILKGVFRM